MSFASSNYNGGSLHADSKWLHHLLEIISAWSVWLMTTRPKFPPVIKRKELGSVSYVLRSAPKLLDPVT